MGINPIMFKFQKTNTSVATTKKPNPFLMQITDSDATMNPSLVNSSVTDTVQPEVNTVSMITDVTTDLTTTFDSISTTTVDDTSTKVDTSTKTSTTLKTTNRHPLNPRQISTSTRPSNRSTNKQSEKEKKQQEKKDQKHQGRHNYKNPNKYNYQYFFFYDANFK